jgi:hypothetical protein
MTTARALIRILLCHTAVGWWGCWGLLRVQRAGNKQSGQSETTQMPFHHGLSSTLNTNPKCSARLRITRQINQLG